jgi:hypothetical protein
MTMNHPFPDDPIRRRILDHVVQHDSEALGTLLADAVTDFVTFADVEMLKDLIWPIFYYSSYWIQRLSAEILGLPVEEEYDLADLLRRFEEREAGKTPLPTWKNEGF